jgi:hypothetical protein
MLEKLVTHDI